MALESTSADLLPVLQGTNSEKGSNGPLAQSLPHTAWDRIAYHLSGHPDALLTIATFSPDLKDVCRPHLSRCYEALPNDFSRRYERPKDDYRFLYHRVLQLVLEGYVDPSYIYEVNCEDAKLDRGNVERGTETLEDLEYKYDAVHTEQTLDARRRRFSGLLHEAVSRSPWIGPDMEKEICEHFEIGHPDVALAVLLPICTKLKIMEIPRHAERTAAVVQTIAQEYHRQGVTGEAARRTAWEAALRDRASSGLRRRPGPDSLPLSELLALYTQDRNWTGFTMWLSEMTAFMGIPSLHRVVLESIRDHKFAAWPTQHAESSCSEIYLQRSHCSRKAILAFAQGMIGPCEIRQQYELDPSYLQSGDEQDLTWDRVLVRRREDGGKDVEASIAFDGGDPGYEHAWVSWMFWGKMQDWRRLDEEFSLQDGDENVVELGAGI